VRRIVLAVPGAVRHADQSVTNAPNLAQLEDPAFLAAVRHATERDVVLENDANAALLGEQQAGSARDTPTAAFLAIGPGLGTGIALDGHLLRGATGVVGEFGQLPVGPLGARLEHLVTSPAILAVADFDEFFSADAPPAVKECRRQFDQALLIVLTAVTVACEPARIVLGGDVAPYLTTALPEYQELLEATLRVSPQLVPAGLGPLSAALGAVVIGLRAVYSELGVPADRLAGLPPPSVTIR
jgi:predicted NBD/HSP70 family sugar kinase